MSEAEDRIRVVGGQAGFEKRLLGKLKNDGWKVAMVNFVPTNITPGFINPDNIETNPESGLAQFKPGTQPPEGLLDPQKARDPKWLATVAERAVTVNDLVNNGAKLTVLAVDTGRPYADKSGAQVIPDAGALLSPENRDKIKILPIPEELQKDNKKTVPAAAYYACKPGTDQQLYGAVFATQVNDPTQPDVSFESFFEDKPGQAKIFIERLNSIVLMPQGLPTIQEMAGKARGPEVVPQR